VGEAAAMRRRGTISDMGGDTGVDMDNSLDRNGDMKKPAEAPGNRTRAGRMNSRMAEAHLHQDS